MTQVIKIHIIIFKGIETEILHVKVAVIYQTFSVKVREQKLSANINS